MKNKVQSMNKKYFILIMAHKYELSIINHYNKKIDIHQYGYLFKKYIQLISEFLMCAAHNIGFRNKKYYLFMIQRGLETIKHCFKILFMYTKNIDLTMHHCKKAYCYYIEFIGQISENSHTYLQLNSKDAILFVYKKTIFQINNDYRKSFILEKEENTFLKYVTQLLDIYHGVIVYSLSNKDINDDNKRLVIQFSIEKSAAIISKFVKGSKTQIEYAGLYELVILFLSVMKTYKLSAEDFCSVCEKFINKIKKKEIHMETLQKKLFSSECRKIKLSYTHRRFVNWLYTA